MIGYIYNIYLLFTLISISKVQSLSSTTTSLACDDSFPLVDTTFMSNSHHTTSTTTTYHDDRRKLIAIPNNHNDNNNEPARYYETGEYYAPLCNDGIHIDIRHICGNAIRVHVGILLLG